MSAQVYDTAVIGAGIAGAAFASAAAVDSGILMLEAESQPGYHSTGRSAAMYFKNYGNATVSAITAASQRFLQEPPDGFTDAALLRPRGAMMIARRGQERELEQTLQAYRDMELLSAAAAVDRVPVLKPGQLIGAAMERDAMDIDVNALHTGYLRRFKAAGGDLVCNAAVQSLRMKSGSWQIQTPQGGYTARTLVNAAGAWADRIASMAGAAPIGLVPKKRTVAIIEPPDACDVMQWPLVADVAETFYFKPESGRLLLSPADETPVAPCDAQPDDLDVAVAVDRLERATRMNVARVERSWAGLRTFAGDRTPVVGWDAEVEGLFWLAGLGGYGIQMSAALKDIAVGIYLGADALGHSNTLDNAVELLSPARFKTDNH